MFVEKIERALTAIGSLASIFALLGFGFRSSATLSFFKINFFFACTFVLLSIFFLLSGWNLYRKLRRRKAQKYWSIIFKELLELKGILSGDIMNINIDHPAFLEMCTILGLTDKESLQVRDSFRAEREKAMDKKMNEILAKLRGGK